MRTNNTRFYAERLKKCKPIFDEWKFRRGEEIWDIIAFLDNTDTYLFAYTPSYAFESQTEPEQ